MVNSICVIGDVHGHLILALCMAAQWQKELGIEFEAVFLSGDVGTFTEDSQLDSTTRKHAKINPCELEFLYQWSLDPQPQWINKIFTSEANNGLGLNCPVVMVHGNHEGFNHLEKLVTTQYCSTPIQIEELPIVDSVGHIKLLPSGNVCKSISGLLVGGIGGIEKGSRYADYHEMAYINENDIVNILSFENLDLIISHHGPRLVQMDHGSPSLDILLETEIAKVWCHSHSTPNEEILSYGPNKGTIVVPLKDVAFQKYDGILDEPGDNAWSMIDFSNEINIIRERPKLWRDYRFRKWKFNDYNRFLPPILLEQKNFKHLNII